MSEIIGLVRIMLDAFNDGKIDRLYLVFNKFINTMAQEPQIDQLLPLPKSEEKELRQLNQKDIALYRQCTKLFDTRYKLYQTGLQYCHALIQRATEQNVSGWAWWEDGSDKPVEIELLLNGKPTKKKFHLHIAQ